MSLIGHACGSNRHISRQEDFRCLTPSLGAQETSMDDIAPEVSKSIRPWFNIYQSNMNITNDYSIEF